MRKAAALCVCLLAACGLPTVDPPHPGRGFDLGQDGPFGAVVFHEQMRLGVEGSRAVTVILPITDANDATSQPPHVGALVFVQGGLVARDRYIWLARHLASRGYAVVLPEYTGWLAFFEPEVTRAAAEHLHGRLGDNLQGWAVVGHSLGGVMAANAFVKDGRYDALLLLASEPQASDKVEDVTRPVLSIIGKLDEQEPEDSARKGFARFGGGGFLASIDLLTHFAWTDEGHDPTVLREREKKSPDRATARFQGCYVVDAFLDHALKGRSSALEALRGTPALPVGTVVEERP